MYVSIIYPLADFRKLHPDNAGQLEKPAWGMADPRAQFARGFGEIHTRTKSGERFAGENYYADCDKLIRYPSQYFLSPSTEDIRNILTYPIYRRFYFDGQMAGRFELGFRLNEGTIRDILSAKENPVFDAAKLATQLLNAEVRTHLLDDRTLTTTFENLMPNLRDGWLLSSTRTDSLDTYDISNVGQRYVQVGKPFLFVRASNSTPLVAHPSHRALVNTDKLRFSLARSGVQRQNFDLALIQSNEDINRETAIERLARLFYTQSRTLAYAHSFYLRQVSSGAIKGENKLSSSLEALVERLRNLSPSENDTYDETTCEQMQEILRNADIDTKQLSQEIHDSIRPNLLARLFGGIGRYADKKLDISIEAAASTATKQILSGGL